MRGIFLFLWGKGKLTWPFSGQRRRISAPRLISAPPGLLALRRKRKSVENGHVNLPRPIFMQHFSFSRLSNLMILCEASTTSFSSSSSFNLGLHFSPLLFTLKFNLIFRWKIKTVLNQMEQHALKKVNNCLYTNNVYSYLETSGGISYNPYLNVVHFFNTRVN